MFDVPGVGRNMGSGFLISKNLVLTAAHNMLCRDYIPPKESTNIRFFLAANG
jgi:V8-like Glu-specific endopeptidase